MAHWMDGSIVTQHDDVSLNLRAYAKFETILVHDSEWTPATGMADIIPHPAMRAGRAWSA